MCIQADKRNAQIFFSELGATFNFFLLGGEKIWGKKCWTVETTSVYKVDISCLALLPDSLYWLSRNQVLILGSTWNVSPLTFLNIMGKHFWETGEKMRTGKGEPTFRRKGRIVNGEFPAIQMQVFPRQGPRLTLGSQTGEQTPKKVVFQLSESISQSKKILH